MSDTYNLTEQPWLPVLMADGTRRSMNLKEVFREAPQIATINTGDPLEQAAIRRLLLAIALAAGDGKEQRWLASHAHRFDVLHPTKPFAQNSRLNDVPMESRPAICSQLLNFSSGHGSPGLHSSLGYPDRHATLPLDEAVRLLLVRQMFSFGGLGSRLGKYTGSTVTSFKQSLHYNTPFLWVQTGTLADDLLVMVGLVAEKNPPLGTFWFGLEAPHTPGDVIEAPGLLDMLTYPARSLKLWRSGVSGEASHLAVYEGLRVPAFGDDLEHYAQVFRHTGWWSAKEGEAPKPRGVRTATDVRADWRHLIECYTTPHNPGLLSPEALLPDGAVVTLTALAGDKSRVDNAVHWEFPVPTALPEVVELVAEMQDNLRRARYGLHGFYCKARGDDHQEAITDSLRLFQSEYDRAERRTVIAALTQPVTTKALDRHYAHRFLAERQQLVENLKIGHPAAAAALAERTLPDWVASAIDEEKEHRNDQ